ncbi:MAG TPA: T9SS type A sorting domain-containing protein, partial [Saprospiraceae bacterium]|nr:T9SS type A sorting domain-containing protein [Saprospiraceae bacterium]
VVTPASNATATDGVALVQQITGGTVPYDIRWSNGASANGIGGLLPGNYTVSITDANDCLFTQTVTVSFTNAVPETQVLPGVFRVAPNPSGSEGAQLWAEAALSGAVQVEILDALGRRAAAAIYLRGRNIDLPRGLSPGMYLIVLRDEQRRQAVLRWVVIKR